MLTPEQLEGLKKYQVDPVRFFGEVLGIDTLEDYQRDIMKSIVENERVAISACHDVGKSYILARTVIWFMEMFPYCKVITTAPTYNQVKNILWAEIRSAYSRSKFPLGGKMNLTEWQMTPDGDWFALGFTPRNELSSEAGQGAQSSFQGFHAPYVLVVFDEATGIPPNIWTMAEGLLTSARVKFVAIGNPTSSSAEFARCFKSPAWSKIRLNCFHSPNLIANGITNLAELTREVDVVRSLLEHEAQLRMQSYKIVRGYLLSTKWVVAMAIKWGMDHPLFLSKVLGEFPTASDGTLIPLGFVEEAQLRLYYPTAADRKTIGLDIARFGSDSTVMTGLHGKKFLGMKQMIKADTTAVAGATITYANEIQADVIVVDETGIGGGVVDLLNEARRTDIINRNTEIRGVQFGAAVPCDASVACEHKDCMKAKYVNMKARMFGALGDDLKAHDGLTLPMDDVYLEELPTILYRFDSKGRMFIESKDEFKKRTGRKSPDHADSLALANFGRYDEMSVGSFSDAFKSGYSKPFAASLGARKTW